MPLPSKKEIEAEFDKNDKFIADDGRFLTGTKTPQYVKDFISKVRTDDLSAIIEWVKGHKIYWDYHRGNCNRCDYLEHSGENHYCEIKNDTLDLVVAHLTSLQKDL